MRARNFKEVDFVDKPEIELQEGQNNDMSLLTQLDFVDRLYLQSETVRFEFGIRRAQLVVTVDPLQEIKRTSHIRNCSNVQYVTLHDAPDALALSIDPPPSRKTLGELSLPPGPRQGENRLSEIGAISNYKGANLQAELSVSLCSEGLILTESASAPYSNRARAALKAIATVAALKYKGAKDGKMRRAVRVRSFSR